MKTGNTGRAPTLTKTKKGASMEPGHEDREYLDPADQNGTSI